MIIQMHFDYPRNVSSSQKYDHAIIKLNKPDLFVSASTGISLIKDYPILQEEIPKQYGTKIDTFMLKVSAMIFIGVVRLITYGMVLYCIWFGYALRDLWHLLYIL